MKLSTRDATRYFSDPDPKATGALIFGADPMRVADRRKQVITGLAGPDAEQDMRLTRLAAADLRSDPAALTDALKAQGFFPGPRVVHLEGATDNLAKPITASLSDWQPGDAQLIVTAGALTARSALRKLFEGHPSAYAIALYDDPPSRDEVEGALRAAGLNVTDRDTLSALFDLARVLEPGDFRQMVEKLSLYKHGDVSALTVEEVTAMAPATVEADVDDILHVVAEGRTAEIGPVLRRLQAQGATATTLTIAATRHFRQLHAAASDPGGASSGIAKARPPIYGPRRDRMTRQAQGWGAARLEQGLSVLTDTDLTLRSAGQTAPQMAVLERALLRLAMMGRARR